MLVFIKCLLYIFIDLNSDYLAAQRNVFIRFLT